MNTNKPTLITQNLYVNCKNRPAYKDEVTYQNGWTPEGSRIMETKPNPMSKSCKLDTKKDQIGCIGCHWRDNLDPRDLVSEVVNNHPPLNNTIETEITSA